MKFYVLKSTSNTLCIDFSHFTTQSPIPFNVCLSSQSDVWPQFMCSFFEYTKRYLDFMTEDVIRKKLRLKIVSIQYWNYWFEGIMNKINYEKNDELWDLTFYTNAIITFFSEKNIIWFFTQSHRLSVDIYVFSWHLFHVIFSFEFIWREIVCNKSLYISVWLKE